VSFHLVVELAGADDIKNYLELEHSVEYLASS
jgi:hypothetical protein